MALYVRTSGKEKAKEILDELLKRHDKDIMGYSLEENVFDLSNLPDDTEIELRKLSRRGGSVGLTLSDSLTKYLNLKVGDYVAIITNKRTGMFYLTKVDQVKTRGGISVT